MAKVYISKSILPNKPLNTFISCVSKHSLKREFSSAVLREGKACLTVPSFCAAPSILFPGGIEAVGTFTIFFCHCPCLLSSVAEEREGLAVPLHPRSSPQHQKMGIEDSSSRNKSQELTPSCDYCRWVEKEEHYKKQKEKGGGEGDTELG